MLSVIIPAYNGAGFLAEAAASIHRQGYTPLEILVVDDDSTDETVQVAAALPVDVRVLQQAHTGSPAAGRNRGVREARGELIGFLDQDDLWPDDKLALQLPHLLKDDGPDVVIGHTQMLHLQPGSGSERLFEAESAPVDYRLVSCALFKRSVFEHVGGFDETLAYFGDDLDWFIRAREQGVQVLQTEDIGLFWRIHAGNTSHNPAIRDHARGYDRALTEVLKKALDRRRGGTQQHDEN